MVYELVLVSLRECASPNAHISKAHVGNLTSMLTPFDMEGKRESTIVASDMKDQRIEGSMGQPTVIYKTKEIFLRLQNHLYCYSPAYRPVIS